MIAFLDQAAYTAQISRIEGWQSHAARWAYHAEAISLARTLSLSDPGQVLEIGSFGAQIVPGSDTMDLPVGPWRLPGFAPTYPRDARQLPWPIASGRYELLVALRVWHHLAPQQEACFREALRVARRVLIVCPETEVVGFGVRPDQFAAWAGQPPAIQERIAGWGWLYLFAGGRP